MAGSVEIAKPFNIRLPAWAVEYIDERAGDRGTTKTEVVLEALRSLRAQEIEGLMREGYEEMREIDRRLAEESMAAQAGGYPE
jgi:hypothetical protein